MYRNDPDGPHLEKTVLGRVVLQVRPHPGWENAEPYQRQKRNHDNGPDAG